MELPESGDCVVLSTISPLVTISVEAVGTVFLYLASHTKLNVSFKRNNLLSAQDSESFDDEDATEHKFEDDLEYLRSLDPKEWKDQDHYAVLGMSELRHRATEDDIKRAYKQKILKHHPDKRKATGEEVRRDDDYFTCITRAWEMLGNPVKRRSYDSVDPQFNDDLPEEKDAKNDFFKVMGKAFEDNSRWSEKKPVPQLGGPETPREKVERFYSFWYDFESWREYSYLDEEDKESGQDRDMRKWIEKKNKATRAKRKKEEMTRIRSLVDTAYGLDPRIKKFQRDDKERKTAAKRAKQEAARARQLEEERLSREAAERARLESERRQSEEKARTDALKQEREAQKKALRRERKTIRDLCKANNYYSQDPAENIKHMESVEKICELFKLARLEEVSRKLQTEGRQAFLDIVDEAERKIEEERQAGVVRKDENNITPDVQVKFTTTLWTENDLQLLIKAVNLFPAGTNQRWEVVANFINQHSNVANSNVENVTRTAKEVLAKAKDLQSTDFSKSSMKDRANKKAFDNFIAEKKGKDDIEDRMPPVTERLDNLLSNGKCNPIRTLEQNSTQNHNGRAEDTLTKEKDAKRDTTQPWTPAEQKLLEQALKTYPTTIQDRWDQIAACIPSRTKKECMRRYKELVELVKAKKAAQLGK